MSIRKFIEKEFPNIANKLKGYKTIKEAEEKKAITRNESKIISEVIVYKKFGILNIW